jgi:glycosyltransferase involved in cell wall biosynthesis
VVDSNQIKQTCCSCGSESKVVDLTNQINSLQNSISWKITAPLRICFYYPCKLMQVVFRRVESAISSFAVKHPDHTYKIIKTVRTIPFLYKIASKRLAEVRGPVANPFDFHSGILKVLERSQSVQLFHAAEKMETTSVSNATVLRVYFNFNSIMYFHELTGIQRVVIELAKSLCDSNLFEVHPIRWDRELSQFIPLNERELSSLYERGGPHPQKWHKCLDIFEFGADSWFLDADFSTDDDPEEISNALENLTKNKMKTCKVFYDVIPHKFPFLYPAIISQRHRVFLNQLMSYDMVIPISTNSANELATELVGFGFEESDIKKRIKPIEIAGGFTAAPRRHAPKKLSDEFCNIIVISTLEHRKNHITLLEAFHSANELLGGRLRLHIVGYPAYSDVKELVLSYVNKSEDVKWHQNLSDAKLIELFDKSSFSIFPSLYEGYGLPIVESLWNHTPCICANWGAMLDIAALGGCLTVDVSSATKLSEAIVQLFKDQQLLNNLIEESSTREFQTWTNYARQLQEALLSG